MAPCYCGKCRKPEKTGCQCGHPHHRHRYWTGDSIIAPCSGDPYGGFVAWWWPCVCTGYKPIKLPRAVVVHG